MGLSRHQNILALYREIMPMFKCLGDEVRAQIMITLTDHGQLNVNQLTEFMDISRPTVSHHLKQLKQAGLVDFCKEGNERFYYCTFSTFFDDLEAWVKLVREECNHLDG